MGVTFDDPTEKAIELKEEVSTDKPVEKEEDKKEETTVEQPKDEKKVIPPTQYEGESETQFNLRLQLFNAGQAKANATTEEEKSLLTEEIKKIREAMSGKKSTETTVDTQDTTDDIFKTEEEKKTALENIRKLGFYSKEDVEKLLNDKFEEVSKKLNQNQIETRAKEHSDAIKEFYTLRSDIASDKSQREMLEKAVIERFKITPDTTKQELTVALDMMANYLFPKSNKTEKAKAAQDKVDLVNITGSQGDKTVSKKGVDPENAKVLKAQGWSDEDIERFG